MTMKVHSAEIYGFLGFIGNAALSKSGSVSLCFYLTCPEPYTLGRESITHYQNEYERALKYMPAGSYLHKQDVFIKKKYRSSRHFDNSNFLQRAQARHFEGREYLEHHCIISFSISGLDSLEPAYEKNPLAYKESLHDKDKARLTEFFDAVEGAVIVLRKLPGMGLRPLQKWELQQYVVQYVNGFPDDDGMRDIYFGRDMDIGEARGAAFVICEEKYLPDEIPSYIEDDTLPKANTALFMPPLEKLGIHLLVNHTINQVIFFEGNTKLKAELQVRADDFYHHRRFSQEVALAAERLKAMNKEVLEEQAILCRGHFSILVWDPDDTVLTAAKDKIREVFQMGDWKHYKPSYEWLQNLFIGTVIGRQNKLDPSYYFLTELSILTTLFTHYGPFRDDAEGILFNDRLRQIPLRVDIWDEAKTRIPARNSLYIASTGGGKSSTCNSTIEEELLQNMKLICVEFGKSFQTITRLYPERSYHVDYDGSSPLGVNPFYIRDRDELTMDKIKTLTVLVLKFWREKEIKEDAKQYVSLMKVLRDYYERTSDGHSFPHFYSYVKDNISEILDRQEIPSDYFDVGSFLHICSEFMPGGVYENVCRMEGSNEDIIRQKDLVVFELTRIKKDPFLVSIVLTILFDVVENKILSNRAVRGKLYLDEYAETAALKDDFTGEDVHSTVSFFFQKLRKENGAISAVIQSPAQLPDNNYTRSIIANTQLLYVFQTTESVYQDIIDIFKIKDPGHIQLMKSLRNDFSGPRRYAEVFIRFMDLHAVVVRLEFSREKFYAFQTDGKDWQALDNMYRAGMSMEEAITEHIKTQQYADKIS